MKLLALALAVGPEQVAGNAFSVTRQQGRQIPDGGLAHQISPGSAT